MNKTQKGILRTNSYNCLDRTNVFQAKACLKIFENLLPREFSNPLVGKILFQLWTIGGDFIHKMYAGSNPALLQSALEAMKNNGK